MTQEQAVPLTPSEETQQPRTTCGFCGHESHKRWCGDCSDGPCRRATQADYDVAADYKAGRDGLDRIDAELEPGLRCDATDDAWSSARCALPLGHDGLHEEPPPRPEGTPWDGVPFTDAELALATPSDTPSRHRLAAIVMEALNRLGGSYRLPRDPSDLAYGVADAILETKEPT